MQTLKNSTQSKNSSKKNYQQLNFSGTQNIERQNSIELASPHLQKTTEIVLDSQNNIQMEDSLQLNSPRKLSIIKKQNKQEEYNLYSDQNTVTQNNSEVRQDTEYFNSHLQKDHLKNIFKKRRDSGDLRNGEQFKEILNKIQQDEDSNFYNSQNQNTQDTKMMFNSPQFSDIQQQLIPEFPSNIIKNKQNNKSKQRKSQRSEIRNSFQLDQNNSYSSKNQMNNKYFNPKKKERRKKASQQVKQTFKYSVPMFFAIVVKVLKFIKQIKYLTTESKNINKLSQDQLQIIGDNSFFKQEKQDKNFNWIALLYNIFYNIWNTLPLIQPNNKLKLIFDVLISIVIIYRMFIVTIKLVFYFENVYECIDMIKKNNVIGINCLYIIDIILNLNTGFYQRGIIISNKKQIVKHYLQGDFIKNTVAQIPLILQYFVTQESQKYLVVVQYLSENLIFLQSQCVVNVFNRIERILTDNEKVASFFPLVRLIIRILLVGHFVGLLWCLCAYLQILFIDEEYTWIQEQNLDKNSSYWLTIYIKSFYWAVSTMATILLYVPQTSVELVFSIFAIFICGGVFGYALNIIGNILDDMNKKEIQFKIEREKVNRFLKRNEISADLKEKVQLYIDYIQNEEKNKNTVEEKQVLNRLSNHLKKEIKQNIFDKIIQRFSIIQNNFSKETIDQCLLNIEEVIYSPESIIYDIGDQENTYLYLVSRGEIQIKHNINFKSQNKHHNKKEFIIQTVKQNELFGFREFFTGQQREDKCVSITSSTVYRINRQNFIDIIEDQNQDYEKFCMIKDNIQFYEFNLQKCQYNNTGLFICTLCKQDYHSEHMCNQIQYKPKYIDFNILQQQGQIRVIEYKRKRQKYKLWSKLDILTVTKFKIFQADNIVSQKARQYQEFYEIISIQDNNMIQNMMQNGFDNIEEDELGESDEYTSQSNSTDSSDSQNARKQLIVPRKSSRIKSSSSSYRRESSKKSTLNIEDNDIQKQTNDNNQQTVSSKNSLDIISQKYNQLKTENINNNLQKLQQQESILQKYSMCEIPENPKAQKNDNMISSKKASIQKNHRLSINGMSLSKFDSLQKFNQMNQSSNVLMPPQNSKQRLSNSQQSLMLMSHSQNRRKGMQHSGNRVIFIEAPKIKSPSKNKQGFFNINKKAILTPTEISKQFQKRRSTLINTQSIVNLQNKIFNENIKNNNQIEETNNILNEPSLLTPEFFNEILAGNIINQQEVLKTDNSNKANLSQKREWDFINFDKPKEYLIYYPLNNLGIVMKNIKIFEKNILKKMKKQNTSIKLKKSRVYNKNFNKSVFALSQENLMTQTFKINNQ